MLIVMVAAAAVAWLIFGVALKKRDSAISTQQTKA
jgi:hypothetical protein